MNLTAPNFYNAANDNVSQGRNHENSHKRFLIPTFIALKARPYNKKDSSKTKNHAVHEVEVMIAGHFANGISGFIELGQL